MKKNKKITKRCLNSVIAIGTGCIFRKGDKLYAPDFVGMFGININKINEAVKNFKK